MMQRNQVNGVRVITMMIIFKEGVNYHSEIIIISYADNNNVVTGRRGRVTARLLNARHRACQPQLRILRSR